MADIMDTLKDLLGDDAEEKIKSVMSSIGDDSGSINMDDISRIGSILSKGDERSNLLLSLKPFMRSSRQQGIDSAIKLLSLSKLSGLF
ncbi:MAG: hypothetical protein Q4B31_01580 [Clostridia bacterium]|nr:hypothetical protein [Clostridia bacterium]